MTRTYSLKDTIASINGYRHKNLTMPCANGFTFLTYPNSRDAIASKNHLNGECGEMLKHLSIFLMVLI